MSTAAHSSDAASVVGGGHINSIDLEFLIRVGNRESRRQDVRQKSLLYAVLFLLRIGYCVALLFLMLGYVTYSFVTSSTMVDGFFRTICGWPAIGFYGFIFLLCNAWLRSLSDDIRLIEVTGALADRIALLEDELYE